MPANSNPSLTFDPIVMDQLACPACLGGLRLEEGRLVCGECRQVYPIVDGIPALIAGRAEKCDSSK
jgi:uncharacterized protein YbaR (Trm112 family)